MAARKIKLKDQLGRVVRVPTATAAPTPPIPSVAPPETARPVATVWKLIREIPANIQKLAKLVGSGFTTRGPDGEWYQRSIAQGEGIAVAKADGVAGNPTIGLAELPNAGGGALQKTQRDDYGRMAGTSDATTDDLEEGALNAYWKEAPQDGRQYARKDAAWSEIDAISIQFPFYSSAGSFSPIPLTADRELPFFLSDGTQANIPLVTA